MSFFITTNYPREKMTFKSRHKGPFKKYVTLFRQFSTPPPPPWHFAFHNLSFSSLVYFELWNKVYREYILEGCLAFRQTFYFEKALETVFKKAKKVAVTPFRAPPPWVSRIIWMTPNWSYVCKKTIQVALLFSWFCYSRFCYSHHANFSGT